MELVFGAGKIDRRLPDVEELLRDSREKEKDFGQLYLEHKPITSARVFVEDLAVTDADELARRCETSDGRLPERADP